MEAALPRVGRGPHLYLKRREDGEAFWYIRDGRRRVATSARQHDPEGAREALQSYIGQTRAPSLGDGDPFKVRIAATLILYEKDKVPDLARPAEAMARLERLNEFFGHRLVADVTPSTCAAYVRWRCHEGEPDRGAPMRRERAIKPQSARRELADLQSALNHAWKSRKLMVKVPVDLPPAGRSRERWLTRWEAARLLLGCLGFVMTRASDIRTRKERWLIWGRDYDRINRHAARFVLLGLRTGTRHETILGLGWMPHVAGGWIDVDRGVIYRRPVGQAETNKRRPPLPLPDRLARHVRCWREADEPGQRVVAWDGKPIAKMRRAFNSAVRLGGFEEGDPVTPHVLRHTFVTWAVQSGMALFEVAALAGMTIKMVEDVYGHHAPDRLRRSLNAVR